MLIHEFMNILFDLEIFYNPISYKRTTLMKHSQLSEFMFLKLMQ